MAPVRLPAFILKTRGPLPCTGAFKFLPHYFPGSTPSHSAVNPLPASAIFLSLLCVSCAQEAAGLRLAYVLAVRACVRTQLRPRTSHSGLVSSPPVHQKFVNVVIAGGSRFIKTSRDGDPRAALGIDSRPQQTAFNKLTSLSHDAITRFRQPSSEIIPSCPCLSGTPAARPMRQRTFDA